MTPAGDKKQAHVFLFDAVTINQFYYGVWAQKSDRRVEFGTPEYWAETAALCERGKLDGIFFADLAAGPNTHRDSYDPAGRDGAFFPAYDPLLVAGIIAATTTDLGIVVTVPTTWTHPFRVVRSFSTLDHLSRGRAGWNIVFSNTPAAARAYGRERPLSSDEYYALADEYIDVAFKLWEGSWDEGAVVADKESRVYVEPGAVHSIEHAGEHFQVDAANYVDPGPQRLPVLAQASGTARGTAFAAKNAELILVGGPTREYCADNIRGIHAAAAEAGRAPGSVKTTALVDVIVGPTREAAQAKADEYDSFITLEGALAFAESKLNPEEHDDDVADRRPGRRRRAGGDRRRGPLRRRADDRPGEGELPLPAPAPPGGRHRRRSRRRDRVLARRRRPRRDQPAPVALLRHAHRLRRAGRPGAPAPRPLPF